MKQKSTIFFMMLMVLLYLTGCGEQHQTAALPDEYIRDIPGADLSKLNDEQRTLAIKIMNEFVCKHGCAENMTIAQAQTTVKECLVSQRLAEIVVDNVRSGRTSSLEEEILRIMKGAEYAASPPPEKIYSVPVGDAPTKGPADAAVTIMIYSDFQ